MNGPGPLFVILGLMAVYSTYDASRTWDAKRLYISGILAVTLLALGSVMFWMVPGSKHPVPKYQQGFGPEWDCNPAYCVKKPNAF